jgi:hypothetical protein
MRHIYLDAKSNLKNHLQMYCDLFFIKRCTYRGLPPALFFRHAGDRQSVEESLFGIEVT